jgi:chromosomal replication initiator protein
VRLGQAVRHRVVPAFRAGLERDLVLVDEAHRLGDRKGTQREVERMLARGPEEGRQFVLASRHHPRALRGFSPRLVSLFLGGMVVETRAPSPEAVVRAWGGAGAERAPEETVRAVLRVAGGDLGVARRLLEEARAEARDAGVPLTSLWVEDLFAPAPAPEDAAAGIEAQVAARFMLSPSDLHGRRRSPSALAARRLALHLLRDLLGMRYAVLGRRFGGLTAGAAAAAARRGREEVHGDAGLCHLEERLRSRYGESER